MAAAEFVWNVPADHPALAGHFPGHPIVPGALLLDRVVSYADVLTGARHGSWQINAAKFLAPVRPGAELVFTIAPGPGASLSFAVRSAGNMVASGSLTPPAR